MLKINFYYLEEYNLCNFVFISFPYHLRLITSCIYLVYFFLLSPYFYSSLVSLIQALNNFFPRKLYPESSLAMPHFFHFSGF